MEPPTNSKPQYDLEQRTESFAARAQQLVRVIKKDIPNIENGKQLARSAGSVAANYIEANESLSKKDFAMRVKICRKEAKESGLWLRLINISDPKLDNERKKIVQEALELQKIFGAIVSRL